MTSKLTLKEALDTNRLADFTEQEEHRRVASADVAELDEALPQLCPI